MKQRRSLRRSRWLTIWRWERVSLVLWEVTTWETILVISCEVWVAVWTREDGVVKAG